MPGSSSIMSGQATGHTRWRFVRRHEFSDQQPSGDTPGVAAAPVAFAGANVPGVAKLIVVPSAHADVFGVGTTAIVGGSMLVPPSPVIAG